MPPAPMVLQQSQLRAAMPRNKASSAAGSAAIASDYCTSCKCQICTCGGHHCRADKDLTTHYDPQFLQTTNAADYNRKDAKPAQSAAPKRVAAGSGAKFAGESTYHAAHSGAAGSPSAPFYPQGNLDAIHPNGSRFFDSESRSEYGNKGYQKRDGFKPRNAVAAPLPFDGHTSNRDDFRSWEGAKPSTPFKAHNELKPEQEGRDFRSESQVNYTQHPYSKTQPFVPARSVANPARFEGESTNHSDFQAWQTAPAQPIRPVGNQQVMQETRDFQSEARQEFGIKHCQPAQSAAPKRVAAGSGAKFAGESTYHAAHSGAAGSPSAPFYPQGNLDAIHPNGSRFFDSESRSEYGNKGYQKRDGFKPRNAVAAPLPFDGHTSNRDDFRSWEGAKPSTPFKAHNELKPEQEGRDFRSESQVNYTQHPYSKTQPFVPARSVANPAKFDASSSHSSDFLPYTFAPCPAAALSDNTVKHPVNGHQLYNQTPRGSWQTMA